MQSEYWNWEYHQSVFHCLGTAVCEQWYFTSSSTILLFFVWHFRRYLRETLKMANAEDLNRLTSCSLVLLGHIFLSLGNSRESMNMVTPAMQLASKIPDVHVQLWASSILKGKWLAQCVEDERSGDISLRNMGFSFPMWGPLGAQNWIEFLKS